MVGQAIKNLLEEREMSVAELARLCDAPKTTLHSIISRDNNTIDLGLLVRVSRSLGTPLDRFFQDAGAAIPELPSDGEWSLLQDYRALDAHGQEAVDLMLSIERKRQRQNCSLGF